MRMTRVGCLEQHIARPGVHQGGEHLVHIDVADMWPFVVAPADMNPHPRRIDVPKRVVQRLDMHAGDLDEFIIAEVGEQHMAGQRQVRTIKLQVETCCHNGFVFRLHRIGQCRQIGFARGIMLVLQKQRDHTRRGGIHKAARCAMRRHARLQIVDVSLKFALPFRRHLTSAHGTGILRRAAGVGEALKKAWELLQVGWGVPRAVAGKAGVAILHIGGVGDFRGFPIGHDVDTGLDLSAHGLVTGRRHAPVKTGLVIGLAIFTGKDEIHHILGTWQRADMACQNFRHQFLPRRSTAGNS